MKRITLKVLLVICVTLVTSAQAADPRDTDVIKVVTQTPIVMGDTREVTASLTGLNTQAREAGMSDAILHGTIKYREIGNAKGKRAVIYWDSIKWQRGTSTTEGGISKPLLSQFTTTEERVEPQTTLTAKGDISALTASFDNVKKRSVQSEKETAEKIAQTRPIEGEQTRASNNGVSGGYVPGAGSYDPNSGNTGGGTNTGGDDDFAVDPVSTTWEPCSPRIAQTEGLVYRQAREIKKNSAGDILNEGVCTDRGDTVPIIRDYVNCPTTFDPETELTYSQYKEFAELDGMVLSVSGCTIDLEKSTALQSTWVACAPRIAQAEGLVYRQAKELKKNTDGEILIEGTCTDWGGTVAITRDYANCPSSFDFESELIYSQFKEVADVDGVVLTVSGCTVDLEKSTPMQSTFEGCGVRHDFVTGVSVQQEQLYYRDASNSVVTLGDCQDSTHTYAQYKTGSTCTDVVDSANGYVIPYQRIAYNLDDGTVQYATECQAQSTSGLEILEEACSDPKYEHDFIANVSYLRTSSYYIDLNGEKKALSACQRSLVSYTHKFDDSECGITNDDEAFMTYWNAKRYIEAEEGNVTISACEQYSNPTAYTYVGMTSSTTSSTKAFAGYTINSLMTLSPASASCQETKNLNGYDYLFSNRSGYSSLTAIAPCNKPDTTFYPVKVTSALKNYYGNARLKVDIKTNFKQFLRGDGTYFNQPDSYVYTFIAVP